MMAAKNDPGRTQIQMYKELVGKKEVGREEKVKKPKTKRRRKDKGSSVENLLGNVTDKVLLAKVLTKQDISGPLEADNLEHIQGDGKCATAVNDFAFGRPEGNVDSSGKGQENKEDLLSLNETESLEFKSVFEVQDTLNTAGKEGSKTSENVGANNSETAGATNKGKKKTLPLRRRRKKSKGKQQASSTANPQPGTEKKLDDKGELKEEKLPEETFAWRKSFSDEDAKITKESSPEKPESSELGKTASQGLECLEELKVLNEEFIEDPEKKKIRAKKFKRWASFGKQKKSVDSPDPANSEQTIAGPNEELKPQGKDKEFQIPEVEVPSSLSEVKSEEHEVDQPAFESEEKVEIVVEETSEISHSSGRKRSISLTETRTRPELLSPENFEDPSSRRRAASFGKGNVLGSLAASFKRQKPKKALPDNGRSAGEDKEIKGEDGCENGSEKLEESLQQVCEESASGIADEGEVAEKDTEEEERVEFFSEQSDKCVAGDNNKEQENSEKPKKKKSFLRRISSKNLKATRKEAMEDRRKTTEVAKPLLQQEVDKKEHEERENGGEEEGVNKRKKNTLTSKISKALKKRRSTEYRVVASEEAEIEAENTSLVAEEEEELGKLEGKKVENIVVDNQYASGSCTQIEKVEKVFQNTNDYDKGNVKQSDTSKTEHADNGIIAEQSIGDEGKQLEGTGDEIVDDTYVFCRALMNSVIKELSEHLKKIEHSSEDVSDVTMTEPETEVPSESVERDTEEFPNDAETEAISELIAVLTEESPDEMQSEIPPELVTGVTEESLDEIQSEIPPELMPKETEKSPNDTEISPETSATEVDESQMDIEPEVPPKSIPTGTEDSPTDIEPDVLSGPIPKEADDSVGHAGLNPTKGQSENVDNIATQPEPNPENAVGDLSQFDAEMEQVSVSENVAARYEEQREVQVCADEPSIPDETKTTLPEDEPKGMENYERVTSVSDLLADVDNSASLEQCGQAEPVRFEASIGSLERGIEVSIKTRALIDGYVFISQSLELSEEFSRQLEMIENQSCGRRQKRCIIM